MTYTLLIIIALSSGSEILRFEGFEKQACDDLGEAITKKLNTSIKGHRISAIHFCTPTKKVS